MEHHETKAEKAKRLLGSSQKGESGASEQPKGSLEAAQSLQDEDEVATGTASESSSAPPKPLVPHFKPNITVCLVNEFSAMNPGKMQPTMLDNMDINYQRGTYEPIVYLSEFWLLRV